MDENKNAKSQHFDATYQMWMPSQSSDISKEKFSKDCRTNCSRQSISSATDLFESWKWDSDQIPNNSGMAMTKFCSLYQYGNSGDSGISSVDSIKENSTQNPNTSRTIFSSNSDLDHSGNSEDSGIATIDSWKENSDQSPNISRAMLTKNCSLDFSRNLGDSGITSFDSWKWNSDQSPDTSGMMFRKNCSLDHSGNSGELGIPSFNSWKWNSDQHPNISRMFTEKSKSTEDSGNSVMSLKWDANPMNVTAPENSTSFEIWKQNLSSAQSPNMMFTRNTSLDHSRDQLRTPTVGSFFSNAFQSSWQSPLTRNKSVESGYKSSSGSFNPLMRDVSFDGCFVENDATTQEVKENLEKCRPFGALSDAITQGGDISRFHENILGARYTVLKYGYCLRNCWQNICFISEMHSNITGKINNLQSPEELNIICVANAFNFVIRQIFNDIDNLRLNPILLNTLQFLEVFIKTINDNIIDKILVKQLKKLTDYLCVMLYMEYQNQMYLSEPLEDQFRTDKLIPTWEKYML